MCHNILVMAVCAFHTFVCLFLVVIIVNVFTRFSFVGVFCICPFHKQWIISVWVFFFILIRRFRFPFPFECSVQFRNCQDTSSCVSSVTVETILIILHEMRLSGLKWHKPALLCSWIYSVFKIYWCNSYCLY